ncbi:unnamed protein product [Plutella xylostella]|uniref:(diamondback moth) hypothetical protein n=1 Tax=Plutella xylostella TaxID=51655 RepID=A0A8S4FCS2_PLUXY|nr:unnamed protein product [Plutella xylostella]
MADKTIAVSALEVGELNLCIDSMEPKSIEAIGNQSWVDWHIRLQKLNQQAVLEATSMGEELTKETLISAGKLPVLVHEAICIQVWRQKIYPQILKLEPEPATTFGIYMVLYHEAAAVGLLETALFHEAGAQCLSDATVDLLIPSKAPHSLHAPRVEPRALYHEAAAVGLLETALFHEAGAQCLSDVTVDLLDYAIEQLTALVGLINSDYLKPEDVKKQLSESTLEELTRQKNDLQFDISMRCITIVRYIAEHMEAVGIGACIASGLYRTHDAPALLALLLQAQPWRRGEEVFESGKWVPSTPSSELHRSEAQLWLCLRQLLLQPRLAQHYRIDDTARATFCRLESKLSESILDQIPPLAELKMFLCRLAVGDCAGLAANGVKSPGCTLVEIVPQIKDKYLKQVHKRAKSIAKAQLQHFHLDGSSSSREAARRLLECYAGDAALALEGGRCAGCGEQAARKCGRCSSEWYCGRECQVKQWSKHKELCDQLSQLLI